VWTFGWTVTGFVKQPIAYPHKPLIREEERDEESNSNEETAALWVQGALDARPAPEPDEANSGK